MSYEAVVVGAGPGGYVSAIRLAQNGVDTAMVDRGNPGGVCLNWGCIPSKALIHVANQYEKIQEADRYGLHVEGATVDMDDVQTWRERVVRKLTGGVEHLMESAGVDIIYGDGTFQSSSELRVEQEDDTQIVEADSFIVATGSTPMEIPGFSYDDDAVLSSREVLELDHIPDHFLLIGGGVIGLELGTVFAKLGSSVSVVELTDQLLPGTDPELVDVVQEKLDDLGVETFLEAQAEGYEEQGDGYAVNVQTGNDQQETIETNCILLAVGRSPNTDDLGLENTDATTDDRGFIQVDQEMRTDDENLFAIGDVARPPLLAHKASSEGIVAAEVISGEPAAADFQAIPGVIFTDPEIATTGMQESEAREKGYDVMTGKFPLSASGRARTMEVSSGFVKVVADRKSNLLLGVQIVSEHASELITEGTLALEMAATLEDVTKTIHPHPTLSESVLEAAEDALGQAIHIP